MNKISDSISTLVEQTGLILGLMQHGEKIEGYSVMDHVTPINGISFEGNVVEIVYAFYDLLNNINANEVKILAHDGETISLLAQILPEESELIVHGQSNDGIIATLRF